MNVITKLLDHERNFKTLFLCILTFLVSIPFSYGAELAQEALFASLSTLMFITVYALQTDKKHTQICLILATATLIGNVLAYVEHGHSLTTSSLYLNLLFFSYAVYLLMRSVFRSTVVSMNLIMGAVCIYLLIGLNFAVFFTLIEEIAPHSFHALQPEGLGRFDMLFNDFLYFSYINLSTLGYGDILPLSAPARYFSAFEAIFGQIYLSVLVARLLGLHLSQRGDRLVK
jgi:voltage-gated potassium channel